MEHVLATNKAGICHKLKIFFELLSNRIEHDKFKTNSSKFISMFKKIF